MTALAFFPGRAEDPSVPLVCPSCGTAFRVRVDTVRAAKSVACPSCRHVRSTPTLPPAVATPRRRVPTEFPRA